MNTIRLNNWLLLVSILSMLVYSLSDTEFLQKNRSIPESVSRNSAPDSTRFTHMMLAQGLDEPMEMAILPDLDVVIVERKGDVKLYDAKQKQLKTIAHINVFSGIEDGLLGVAADPEFERNHWLYLYYGVGGDKNVSHLARYDLNGDQLDLLSKKVLLEIPTQRTYCCHSAGYLTFSADGLLYLSTGDNTNAEEIEGHNPTDERPGRQLSDDQASTANSKDYRGKILRIKPLSDGSYSIPDGNLFPKDGSLGYPEIYVMGCRNPFRVSVDPKTNFVYWGDVGPDTNVPAEENFLSYDEINQARKPGFFGYPYFLGNNEGFPKYDFETKKEGPKQDPLHPINNSPNNSGIKKLPPAQPAMIWYGKGESKRWPLVGKGAASAMAGPVYYSDLYPGSKYKLPDYYNGKLFIYDWIRKWIMAVTLDQSGNYVSMEPFMPHLKVVAPMDMQIAKDGSIYMLAYGTNWFAKNNDAGLIRIEYSEGNRNPLAIISGEKMYGAAPMTIHLTAAKSMDYDQGDILNFEWQIGSEKLKGKEINKTLSKPGIYNVSLTVSDNKGGAGTATTQIKVGNTPPVIDIATNSNRTFYFDNSSFDYDVKIHDTEDKKINDKNANVSFNYLPIGKDFASALSGSSGNGNIKFAGTEKLYASLDCKSCHTMNTKSIGPPLKEISKRYQGNNNAPVILAKKIITGGSGNWGTYPMPPHSDLSENDAISLAGYILSLENIESKPPLKGDFKLTDHVGKGHEGAYIISATYTDNGANGIEPLEARQHIILKDPLVQMEDFDQGNVSVGIGTLNTDFVTYVPASNGKFISFKKIDLKNISSIKFRVQESGEGGRLEIRIGSLTGKLAGSVEIREGKLADPKSGWKEIEAKIQSNLGQNDLFLVFTNPDSNKKALFNLDWMRFQQ